MQQKMQQRTKLKKLTKRQPQRGILINILTLLKSRKKKQIKCLEILVRPMLYYQIQGKGTGTTKVPILMKQKMVMEEWAEVSILMTSFRCSSHKAAWEVWEEWVEEAIHLEVTQTSLSHLGEPISDSLIKLIYFY